MSVKIGLISTGSSEASGGGGGGGTPGGTDEAVQFNDSGSFGGDASLFAFDKSTGQVTLNGDVHFVPGTTALLIVDPATTGDNDGSDIAVLAGDAAGSGSGGNASFDTGAGAGAAGQTLYLGNSNAASITLGRPAAPLTVASKIANSLIFAGDEGADLAIAIDPPSSDGNGTNLTINSAPPNGANSSGNLIIDTGSSGTPSGQVRIGTANCAELVVGNTGVATRLFGDLELDNPLAVSSGGTGSSSFTDGQILIGNSSDNTLTPATLTQGANITISNGNGTITIAAASGGSVANPTALVGLSAVNGTASSAIRSDGAPALDQTIAPTWTGNHRFNHVINAIGGLDAPGNTLLIGQNATTTSIGPADGSSYIGAEPSHAFIGGPSGYGLYFNSANNTTRLEAPSGSGLVRIGNASAQTLFYSPCSFQSTAPAEFDATVTITDPASLVIAGYSDYTGIATPGSNPTNSAARLYYKTGDAGLCFLNHSGNERVILTGVSGTATLSGGTATVTNANATTASTIQLTYQDGTLVAAGFLSAVRSNGSFAINSSNVIDGNKVGWTIFN